MPKISTYERLIQDPKRKKKLDEDYKELLLTELLDALAQKNYKAALNLAHEIDFHMDIH